MHLEKLSPELLAFLTRGEMKKENEGEMVSSVAEINRNPGANLYFILGHKTNNVNSNMVEIFGCPSKEGLMALAIHFNVFTVTNPDTVFRGIIQNTGELPYTIKANEAVLIVYADYIVRIFYKIDAAASYIEAQLKNHIASTIDDFAVIVGEELEFDYVGWNTIVMHGVMGNGWY